MFDLKNNNNISTFLLLVVLGLLIWYMTKPKKETFTNDMTPEQQPTTTTENQTEPQTNQPIPQVQSSQPAQPAQPVVIQPSVPTQQKVAQPSIPIQEPRPINKFEGYDSAEYSTGADINSAFQPPVTTDTSINAVDINKQSIQNYNAKDFLPKEINDQWFDTDFSQAKTNINDDKLINTERYVIGINTVGQSLKNASYDIRGTIANPKFSVSPWNNSTYEPDYNIKPLC
jgi:hypothetical protein